MAKKIAETGSSKNNLYHRAKSILKMKILCLGLTSPLATFIIEAEDFSSESTSKSYNQFILKEIKDELLHEDPPIITDKQGSVHDTS